MGNDRALARKLVKAESGFTRGVFARRAPRAALLVVWLCGALGCAQTPVASHAPEANDTVVHTERDGRRYHVERVPKIAGRYYWIDADTIRYYPFAIFKVEAQDDSYIYIKQYIVDPQPARAPEKQAQAASPSVSASHLFALQPYGNGLPRTGQWRNDFTIADMNGDGHLDIVFGPARKSMSVPAIFLGDGQGNWQRWHDAKYPQMALDYGGVAVADFNGDGIPDLALGMHLRGVTVLTGDGKGHFARYDQNLPTGASGDAKTPTFSSTSLQAIDWDGDGRTDVVALSEGLVKGAKSGPGGLTTFLNQAGAWARADIPAVDKNTRVDLLTRVAADAAQKPKLVAISGAGVDTAMVYESTGDHWDAHNIDTLPKGAIVRAVAAAEVNGKGVQALVLSYQIVAEGIWHSAIDVFYLSHGAYVRRSLYDEASQRSLGALALGHLSSPTSWDLVALRDDGTMLLFAADGEGFFTRDLESPPPDWRRGCAGSAVHLRDLDGDGIDEVAASFSGEPSAVTGKHECMNGGAIEVWKITKPN